MKPPLLVGLALTVLALAPHRRHFHSWGRGEAQLACGGQQWHHVALEFPGGAQRRYQSLVAEAARAIDLAENDGCTAPMAGNER